MRTMTVEVYKFNELSEAAKDNARTWFREGNEYPWFEDALASVRAFCDAYGVTVKDYSLGDWGCSYIDTDVTNANLRGVKLKDINREAMTTGYCLDNDLWYTFYDVFKRNGDALSAFNYAIDAAVKAIVQDIRYHYSDECVDGMLDINGYEFTEDGCIV